jgi:hypothetical protein
MAGISGNHYGNDLDDAVFSDSSFIHVARLEIVSNKPKKQNLKI